MKKLWKRLLAVCTALAMAFTLSLPALAAEGEPAPAEPAPVQQPDPWAYEYFADGYALGLVDDSYGSYIKSVVTQEQLDAMTGVVAAKLALLGLPARTAEDAPLVVDQTRGGVFNAMYQVCADYELDGVEEGCIPFLQSLGVVRGTPGGDLALGNPCTYQEAMIVAVRLVLAIYDGQDAGSRGLLWKAVNGSNTLYLLGTIHMDRNNVYPFHKSLRAALASAQAVFLELDFNDQAGQAELAAMQVYADGTTLADHISPELYARTVQVFAALGVPEEQVACFKPWVLATALTNALAADESTTTAPMAVDLYVNAAAVNAGKPVAGIETYALQGGIFDTLSPEYQETYLESCVDMVFSALSGGGEMTEEEQKAAQAAAELQAQTLDAMMEAWKAGDAAALEATYGKAAIVESDDELNARLFTDRDPNMISRAAELLETEGENTFFLAVGAGHMADPGGIVNGLRDLGYTVEQVK